MCDDDFLHELFDCGPYLDTLLLDKTTGSNIIWATNNYRSLGRCYSPNSKITKTLITHPNNHVIKTRVDKDKIDRTKRSKENGEVFTPSYICAIQNNQIDKEWLDQTTLGMYLLGTTTSDDRMIFVDKGWQEYVLSPRIEITCGESPYLANRYDAVSGKKIELMKRNGILDRKLRAVSENTFVEDEWIKWAKIAFCNTYGFDLQGDNVLISRINLLKTFFEYYCNKFNSEPGYSLMNEILEIIVWNIWQMDGMKMVVPNTCHYNPSAIQKKLFEDENNSQQRCIGCETGDCKKHIGKYCIIMDWKKNKKIKFVTMI